VRRTLAAVASPPIVRAPFVNAREYTALSELANKPNITRPIVFDAPIVAGKTIVAVPLMPSSSLALSKEFTQVYNCYPNLIYSWKLPKRKAEGTKYPKTVTNPEIAIRMYVGELRSFII